MRGVCLCIHTTATAIGLAFWTAQLTHTGSTDFASPTGIFADTTVEAIGLCINTSRVTNRLTLLAVEHTLTTLADLTVRTSGATLTTVDSLTLKVKTSTITISLPCWTGDQTCSIGTYFAFLTGFSTRPTVIFVSLQVDTGSITVFLTDWTLGFDTFALITIVLTGTVFDFRRPLETTFGIFDTEFILTGDLSGFRLTLKSALCALFGRTVRDTFFFFTLLAVTAGFPSLTLTPYTKRALLRPLDTSVAVFGQTTPRVSGRTLHTVTV